MPKAPLSQTLILTEDGSTIAMTAALAVTIPAIVVTQPKPEFTDGPTIVGAPQVGQTLTVTSSISNGVVVSRRWLLGAAAVSTAQVYLANAAGTLTVEETAVGPGGTTVAVSAPVVVAEATAPGFDATIAAPELFLAKNADGVPKNGFFPPPLGVSLSEAVRGGSYGYELRRGSYDQATGQVAPVKTYSGQLTDADATGNKIDMGLAADNITTPFFYDMRITHDGRFGSWSKPVKHGDVTAAVMTAGSNGSGIDELLLTHSLVFDEPVYATLVGADGGLLETYGSQPSTSIGVRVLSNGHLDYEAKPSYAAVVRAVDLAGNVSETPFTISVTDRDEVPLIVAFARKEGAALDSDVISPEITIADIAADITVPVSATVPFSINGGAFVTEPTRAVLGDKVRLKVHTPVTTGAVSAQLSYGPLTASWEVRTVGYAPVSNTTWQNGVGSATLSNGNHTAGNTVGHSRSMAQCVTTVNNNVPGTKVYAEVEVTTLPGGDGIEWALILAPYDEDASDDHYMPSYRGTTLYLAASGDDYFDNNVAGGDQYFTPKMPYNKDRIGIEVTLSDAQGVGYIRYSRNGVFGKSARTPFGGAYKLMTSLKGSVLITFVAPNFQPAGTVLWDPA